MSGQPSIPVHRTRATSHQCALRQVHFEDRLAPRVHRLQVRGPPPSYDAEGIIQPHQWFFYAVASRPYPGIAEGSFFSETVSLRSTPPLTSSWSPPLPMPRILFSHGRGFSAQSLRDPIRESQKAVSFRRPSRYARPHHSQVRGPPLFRCRGFYSATAEVFLRSRFATLSGQMLRKTSTVSE